MSLVDGPEILWCYLVCIRIQCQPTCVNNTLWSFWFLKHTFYTLSKLLKHWQPCFGWVTAPIHIMQTDPLSVVVWERWHGVSGYHMYGSYARSHGQFLPCHVRWRQVCQRCQLYVIHVCRPCHTVGSYLACVKWRQVWKDVEILNYDTSIFYGLVPVLKLY